MSANKSSSGSRDVAQIVCPPESTDGLFFKQCLGLYLNKFKVPKHFFLWLCLHVKNRYSYSFKLIYLYKFLPHKVPR